MGELFFYNFSLCRISGGDFCLFKYIFLKFICGYNVQIWELEYYGFLVIGVGLEMGE